MAWRMLERHLSGKRFFLKEYAIKILHRGVVRAKAMVTVCRGLEAVK